MTWSKEEQWQVLRWRKRKKGKRKQKKVKMRLTKGISQISIRLLLFVRHFCLLSRYINFHYYLKWQITSFLLYLLKEQFFLYLSEKQHYNWFIQSLVSWLLDGLISWTLRARQILFDLLSIQYPGQFFDRPFHMRGSLTDTWQKLQ